MCNFKIADYFVTGLLPAGEHPLSTAPWRKYFINNVWYELGFLLVRQTKAVFFFWQSSKSLSGRCDLEISMHKKS